MNHEVKTKNSTFEKKKSKIISIGDFIKNSIDGKTVPLKD